jgi:DNA-binding MarR family transcriptional regulator
LGVASSFSKRSLTTLISSGEAEDEKLAAELKGNTLRVYMYVLKSRGNVGVREAQRALGFSSPTLATYHLDKLAELGLVEKRYGEYHLVRQVQVGVLKQFIRVGAFLLPRYLFYATMFTTLLSLYTIYLVSFERFSFSSIFALLLGALAATTSWYETWKAWRGKTQC